MKKIILISDTHNSLDKRFFPYFNNIDEIWHAGDIGDISITDKLKSFAPLRAVWGNIDNSQIRSEFSETICFTCEAIKVVITHIGGYPKNYNSKVTQLIKAKKPDLFICGHSHILKVIYDEKYKLLHMNPGAIGDYGIHQIKTMLSFEINIDKITNLKVIEFPRN